VKQPSTSPKRKPVRGAQPLGARSPKGGIKSGASQSQVRSAHRFNAYLQHHQITAVESLVRLLKTPVQSLLTWLVVAIALALPTMLYVALDNMQGLGQGWQSSSQMSVFIHQRAREAVIISLQDKLRLNPQISAVEYISPQRALEEFQAYSGFGQVVESLEENPMPAVLLVQPVSEALQSGQLEALRQAIAAEPIVDDVRIDMAWVQRLQQLMMLGQRLVMALALLLALGVLLVIGNTIRLAIESRRDEIVIVKLVGGTDAFVRRPFLYTGFWYGAGGGLLAILLLVLGISWLAGPVARLADMYQSDFRLQGLDSLSSLMLILGAGLLGLSGAWVAVGRHLGQIEPG